MSQSSTFPTDDSVGNKIPSFDGIMTIREYMQIVSDWAVRTGWRGPDSETQRTTGDDIALIQSELSEALEAFRESGDPCKEWFSYHAVFNGVKFKNLSWEQFKSLGGHKIIARYYDASDNEVIPKPEGVPSELADALVRIFDYCAYHQIDLQAALDSKITYNETRDFRHGGKHL